MKVNLMDIVVDLNDEFFGRGDNCDVFNKSPYEDFGSPFSYASNGFSEEILLFDNVIYNPENDCDWCEDDEDKEFETEEEFVREFIKMKVNAFFKYVQAVSFVCG